MNNLSIHDDAEEISSMMPEANVLTEGKFAKKIGASLIAGSIAARPGETAKRPEIPAEPDKTAVADSTEPGKEVDDTVTVPSDKVELKPTLTTGPDGISDPVTFNMGAIADTSGMWGTEAGRKFIDSLKRFYAGYGIIATFDNIKVNLHHVSKETIRELCVDPGSGESLVTEYACTVNYPEQYGDIVADIKFRYDNIRKAEFPAIDKLSVFTKSKTHGIIPGYDREQLSFNIYVDKSLLHLQEKNILVHELKHCTVLYAVVQRMVSLYARHRNDMAMENYAAEYGRRWKALNTMLNAYLDIDSESFSPDVEYVSRRDMIPFIKMNPFLMPVVQK